MPSSSRYDGEELRENQHDQTRRLKKIQEAVSFDLDRIFWNEKLALAELSRMKIIMDRRGDRNASFLSCRDSLIARLRTRQS